MKVLIRNFETGNSKEIIYKPEPKGAMLIVWLRNDSDFNNLSINDVLCAVDGKGCTHSNQYQKPEGGLYKYTDFLKYLKSRFMYDSVYEAKHV